MVTPQKTWGVNPHSTTIELVDVAECEQSRFGTTQSYIVLFTLAPNRYTLTESTKVHNPRR